MDDNNNQDMISTSIYSVPNDSYNFMNNLFSNTTLFTIIIVVICIFLLIFLMTGDNNTNTNDYSASVANLSSYIGMDDNKSSSIFGSTSSSSSSNNFGFLGILAILVFIILIAINGFQYFFGMNIVATLKNLFTPTPEIDINVETPRLDALNAPVPEILIKEQVFNIPGNNYGYEDAKALCSAYGARLANYAEVEDAYNKGGEWCNYGWSDGQMALFPTQQSTFDGLQKIEGHENDCGRPGVNGGYMANPHLKFGVNCYGFKPKMTQQEEMLMETEPIYPKTMKDIAMEQRVKYWKNKLSEILVSPFNSKNWSRL